MPAYVVVGAQWGDEGKGKIVDLLTERVDVVARYGGGPNAGHTICVGDRRFALHHVPSGILRDGVVCVIGNGVVIEPASLLREIEELRRSGIRVEDNLRISDRAHLILPYHRGRDIAREEAARDGRIGTTRLGVGPTYEGKAARYGVRVADLADPQALLDRIRALAAAVAAAGDSLPEEFNPPAEKVTRDYLGHGEALRLFITDTATLLNRRLDDGAVILCEGAQGTMLDLDHGGYPYVTSSTSTAGGACTGLGISPVRVAGVIGVMKAYSTRVGEGPMPTEQDNAEGERIRQRGREFGSTTGRPRRCGWFDAVVARYAVMVNRIESVALTLFDVLDDFETIPVCIGYECDGRRIDTLPGDSAGIRRCRPVYESLPGWRRDTSTATRETDLPEAARAYVRRIETLIGCEVGIISASPQRDRTIVRPEGRIAAWLPRRTTAG